MRYSDFGAAPCFGAVEGLVLAYTISLQALQRRRFTGAGAVIQSAESALLDGFISPFNAIHAERERVPILLRPRTKYGE